MRTAKYRFIALLILCVLLVQSLASCALSVGPRPAPSPSNRDPYADLDKDLYKIGNTSVVYNYTAEEEELLRHRIDELKRLLDDGTNVDKFMDSYIKTDNEFNRLTSQAQIAYVEYCIFGNSKETVENYLYVNALRSDIVQELVIMYRTIYDSPFRSAFYEDWTEDEIRQALDMADQYTDEFMELNNKTDELLVEYRELDPGTYTGRSKIQTLYLEFAKTNDEIAKKLGYENYMEYAYSSVYGRDYSYEQADEMAQMIAECIVSYLPALYEQYVVATNALLEQVRLGNPAATNTLKEYFTMMEATITDEAGLSALESYFSALGEEPLSLFNDLTDGGNYFVVSDESAYNGAFTFSIRDFDEPILYFGPDYQDLLTAVHEFGHYMAYILGPDSTDCYDLAEMQSQGNEMLYLQYLYENYSKEAVDLVVMGNMLNAMLTMVNACAINSFETYVYTHLDDIDANDFELIYNEALSSMIDVAYVEETLGMSLSDYWYYVVVESPGYYISYAISLVGALELFSMADDNYEDAQNAYLALIQADSSAFCAELEDAGLYTPFDPNAYALIEAMLESLLPLPTVAD